MPDRSLDAKGGFRLIKPPAQPSPARFPSRLRDWLRRSLAPFAIAFVALLLLHLPLLALPYFWDEAGYYIPAARDFFLTGDLIPRSTAVNSHPPLVTLSLALAWKLAGFRIAVTRVAMLLWAALALAGLYRLARRVANPQVALGTAVLTGLYPVFFAQSSLAHLDVAAAALTFWGLLYYVERRSAACAVAFALAALAKETALITPLALLGWEATCWLASRRPRWAATMQRLCARTPRNLIEPLYLMAPCVPVAGWMAYQYWRTGHLLGAPEFVAYNLGATLSPARFLFALPQRVWQTVGHMNMYVLLAATVLAMFYPALPEDMRRQSKRRLVVEMPMEPVAERTRIALPTQLVFAVVIVAHVVFLSLIGGALLARYMLPAVPLFVLICVSTLRRRVAIWPYVLAIVAGGFVVGLVVNPPYRFAPEDNLAYSDFVLLHRDAARLLEQRYPRAAVLTAWPASDELTRPYLGYVQAPMRVLRIEDFSAQEVEAAAQRSDFDVALLFSTKYEPPGGSLTDRSPAWRRVHERWFGYHRDLPPEVAAQVLGGRLVYLRRRGGQWIAMVEIGRVVNAD